MENDVKTEETVVETETKEVETVNATETKEDTKNVKDENIDITASADNSPSINTDDLVLSDDTVNAKVEDTEVTTTDAIVLSEQSKQLEEIQKQAEEFKQLIATLQQENEKLKSDISSLRENPFYKSTVNSATREIKNSNLFTAEDVKKMQNRI